MVGIFGAGMAHLRLADGRHRVIDGYTLAPAAARPDMYRPVSDTWPDYMKVEGEMVRFAADSGSPEIRPGVRSRYFGTSHWFRLSFTDTNGGAHLTVGDHADNIVFDAEGKVWCDGDNT